MKRGNHAKGAPKNDYDRVADIRNTFILDKRGICREIPL